METNKIKLYVLECLLLAILILALFESNIFTRLITSLIVIIFAFIFRKVYPKKEKLSIYAKQALYIVISLAILYLALFYATGFYFGFYKIALTFGWLTLSRYIIPVTLSIIGSELIRFTVISQKSKFATVLMIIITVLIDVRINIGVLDIKVLSELLTIIGYIIFASIASGLLFNYITKRFGILPCVVYRLITCLYIYILPIAPDMIVFFQSIARMVWPYIVFLVLDNAFAKSIKVALYQGKNRKFIYTGICLIIMLLTAALISCNFTYGAIVIGSGSMTGTINKGDVIVYKAYNNEKIENDDIIVFNQRNVKIIHRVINNEIENGEQYIYTKGDYNPNEDNWVLTRSDVVGRYMFRIPYAGYPTLWVSDLFK